MNLPKINAHHVYGMMFVALGAITANLNTLKMYVEDKTFGLITIGVGVASAVIGFLKSGEQ